MKKIIFVLMLMMASVTAFSQSKTYKVRRGESIESIANKHGVSVSALIQENPEAAYNFSGRKKLIIPSGKYGYSPTEEIVNIRRGRAYSRQGQGMFAAELEFQYVMIGGPAKDVYKDFNCGISSDYGYNYYFLHNLFMEGFVGYRWYSLWMYNDVSLKVHNITMPIHLGGHIDITDNFGIRPFFGPRIDFPFSSRYYKEHHYSESAHVKTAVTLEFGLDFQFDDNWGIRAKYGLGVGYNEDMNYFSIGITAGF